jgi:hypothetical protein
MRMIVFTSEQVVEHAGAGGEGDEVLPVLQLLGRLSYMLKRGKERYQF